MFFFHRDLRVGIANIAQPVMPMTVLRIDVPVSYTHLSSRAMVEAVNSALAAVELVKGGSGQ